MADLTPDDPPRGSPAWWDARYRSGDIPWDTGVVPPEVVALVDSGLLASGWALDLGCGSGVSSRYLARHGYRVVGVDLALQALSRAEAQARAAGLPAYFCRGDVADLSFLRLGATFALDVGCFHGLPAERRAAYAASLAAHLLPGAYYLLYAFRCDLQAEESGPAGVTPLDIAVFSRCFTLRWTQHGFDRERGSTWYLLQRV